MLVAQCNAALFDATPSVDLDRETARLAKHCGSGSIVRSAHKRVDGVRARLKTFNRSGKHTELPALDIQILESQISGDDPTDPTD